MRGKPSKWRKNGLGKAVNSTEKKPFKRKEEPQSEEEDEQIMDSDDDKPEEGVKESLGDEVKTEPVVKFENKPMNKTAGAVAALFKDVKDMPFMENRDVTPVSENVFSSKLIQDMPIHPHSVSFSNYFSLYYASES